MNNGRYLNGRYEERAEVSTSMDKFQDPWEDRAPSQEETFNHMYEIIDNNHLTHELTASDWEVLEFLAPDIPMNDISDTTHRYFQKIQRKHQAKIRLLKQ